jgi:Tol biopolymer transport system component
MRWINRIRHFAIAAGLAAALAALAALAATAHAAVPGTNGSIVFMRFAGTREDDHTAQLFVRTPAGAERQITHVPGGAFDPDWSPDGSRIVFERWASRRHLPDQLYTVNADGSGLHPLASGCSKATNCLADDVPAWSPDGTQIAFVRYYLPFLKAGRENIPSAADLMLVPAAGGAPQVLRHFVGDPLPRHPAWSPDGKQLVFPLSTAKQPTKQTPILDALNVLDIASGALRAITPLSLGAGDPDWSPDGTRILFNSEAGHSQFAYVVNPDGSGLHKVAHKVRNHSRRKDDARFIDARTLRPRWSPDGRKIVFFGDTNACGSHHLNGCRRGPDRMAVFVMNADGSGAHRLTDGARFESSPSWAPLR